MNTELLKKYGILLIAAIVLSFAIIRNNSIGNVPFCHYSAGCRGDEQPQGKITNQTYGYPLAYKQTQTFNPTNSDESKPNYAGYAETKVENQAFSLPSVIINVIFWFALLHLLASFWHPRRRMSGSKQVGEERNPQ